MPPSPEPHYSDPDSMYHSDPGYRRRRKKKPQVTPSPEKYLGYYSEPDAKYLEIDYHFLKQLSKLAEINLKYRRKVTRNKNTKRNTFNSLERHYVLYEKLVNNCSVNSEEKTPRKITRRKTKMSKRYTPQPGCEYLCCSICTLNKETGSAIPCASAAWATSHSSEEGRRERRGFSGERSYSGERGSVAARRGSVHSVKSVSFIEDIKEAKSPGHDYTGKSFTNDLKQFLLKPSSSRFSLKDKILMGFRMSFDDRERPRRKSPSVGLIKGLWKSL